MNPVEARTRILLADDHKLVRAGLKLLIAEMAAMEVVGEACNGAEALEFCTTLKPDVALIDISMPVMNGLDALQGIRQHAPEVHIIILSMLASEEHVIQALRLGAKGYLIKDSAPAELELAIRCVLKGETWLSPPISRQVVDGYLARVSSPQPTTTIKDSVLTERQLEVLTLLAQGLSAKEIAFELNLSSKTVETHRALLMKKLGLQDIAALVRYAIRNKLISLD